jgi:hypothetical protein
MTLSTLSYSKRIPSPAMLAAAPSSPDLNCSLPAIFVVLVMLALVVDVLVAPPADELLIVNVLVGPLANEPPVAEEVEMLRANTAEILLASIFAPHGLPVPGVPVLQASRPIGYDANLSSQKSDNCP